MDQIGGVALKSLNKLLRQSLMRRFQAVFPGIPNNVIELPINAVTNTIEYEYQSPAMIKIFNMLKKKNVFGEIQTAKDAAQQICTAEGGDDGIIKKIEVQEQGFINISLNDQFIEAEINSILKNGLFYPIERKQKIVVDFSSPNIAKEMHVGHLRSTILGESICRIFEFQGHEVIRVNHLGDWGTQFGMLINYMLTTYPDYQTNKPQLSELEDFYRAAKKCFDSDEEFKKQSQLYVVKLQAYDPVCIDAWKMICALSKQEYEKIYQRLHITNNDYGESYYNPIIPDIIKACEEKGIVEVDKGAKIIRVKGEKVPLMIVKSDGGYNYDSTDMAAAKTRLIDWKADRVLILTDVGQYPHFKLIFEGAKMMGWYNPPQQRMEHMGFGLVLGPDGKKFKTRDGNAVKLIDLLNEGRANALNKIIERVKEQAEGKEFTTGSSLDPKDYEEVAEKIGMAAIKYFDLKQNRISDYAFIYDKMLDSKGNTAVYLLYSYVRIVSVLKKADIDINEVKQNTQFKITHPHERHLAAQLLRLVDVLEGVTDQLAINWLCDYIYDICVKISESYTKYRILEDEFKVTRILLCEAVRIVLHKSFHLVGIDPIEKI